MQNELDAIPVVEEFKDTQVVVNDVLQLITGTIARSVTKDIIESTGGDVLAGETGSKLKKIKKTYLLSVLKNCLMM